MFFKIFQIVEFDTWLMWLWLKFIENLWKFWKFWKNFKMRARQMCAYFPIFLGTWEMTRARSICGDTRGQFQGKLLFLQILQTPLWLGQNPKICKKNIFWWLPLRFPSIVPSSPAHRACLYFIKFYNNIQIRIWNKVEVLAR